MKTLFTIAALALAAVHGPRACAAAGPLTSTPPPSVRAAAKLATPSVAHKVGEFTLVNDGRKDLGSRVMSFGQVFQPGDVMPGAKLQIFADGEPIPTQMDAKAFNPDGSIRHAVVTIEAPMLRVRQHLRANIMADPAAEPVATKDFVAVPGLDVIVILKGQQGPRIVDLDLQAIVRDPKNAAHDFWLDGPLARERRFTASLDDHLQVVFDVFTPRSGPARVDVAFHNDWTGIHQDDVRTYDVKISVDGAVAYQALAVRHYPFTNWHRVIWTDAAAPARVVPNPANLETAAAIPLYALNAPIARGISDSIVEAAGRLDDKPLSPAMVTMRMPNTGGRIDIGPLPTWAVVDLLEGNAATRKALLANADAAGAVPWHLRDRTNGRPLSLDEHPDLWLDPRGHPAPSILPEPFQHETHGWLMDDSHQPSLVYLPYLLTGSQYYRDELAEQAAFDLLFYDPGFRGGDKGLIIGKNGDAWQQVRGLAWSLRTLANAAYILPANDPMQPYFDRKLRGNLAKLVELYVTDRKMKSAGAVEGWVPGAYSPDGMTAPWQQGFLAIVLKWTNDMGYGDGGRMVGWMSNFLTGLFLNGDMGFDPNRGVAYRLPVFDPDTGQSVETWKKLYDRSELPGKAQKELDETWQDYSIIMRSALGDVYSITGSPGAAKALGFVSARTDQIDDAEARGDPTFAIIPSRPLPLAPR